MTRYGKAPRGKRPKHPIAYVRALVHNSVKRLLLRIGAEPKYIPELESKREKSK